MRLLLSYCWGKILTQTCSWRWATHTHSSCVNRLFLPIINSHYLHGEWVSFVPFNAPLTHQVSLLLVSIGLAFWSSLTLKLSNFQLHSKQFPPLDNENLDISHLILVNNAGCWLMIGISILTWFQESQQTALMIAAKKGNVGIVRKLIMYGANVNLTNRVWLSSVCTRVWQKILKKKKKKLANISMQWLHVHWVDEFQAFFWQ